MNNQVRESAERETNKAIAADEKANNLYYEILRRFTSVECAKSKARFTSVGLKEIDAAWLTLNQTNKNLRRAYMKLYCTYL